MFPVGAVTAPICKTRFLIRLLSTIVLSSSPAPVSSPHLVPPAAAMATGGDDPFTPAQLAAIREILGAEIDTACARNHRSLPPDGAGPSGEFGWDTVLGR